MRRRNDPLMQYLYRVSLEPSGLWWWFIGTGLESEPPYLNIGNLHSFIFGFETAAPDASDDDGFFLWLRDEERAFPGQGWWHEFLKRAGGDHESAISIFFSYLHKFLLAKRPAWFESFNQRPQPSLMFLRGCPRQIDSRIEDHVVAVTGAKPSPAPRIRLCATEVVRLSKNSHTHGAPRGMGGWWNGDSWRIVQARDARALDEIREKCAPPPQLTPDEEIVVIDIRDAEVDVFCRGPTGVVLVRDSRLFHDAPQRERVRWSTRAGDTLLILSPAMLATARAHSNEVLPAKLVDGHPYDWATEEPSNKRQSAVSVRWG